MISQNISKRWIRDVFLGIKVQESTSQCLQSQEVMTMEWSRTLNSKLCIKARCLQTFGKEPTESNKPRLHQQCIFSLDRSKQYREKLLYKYHHKELKRIQSTPQTTSQSKWLRLLYQKVHLENHPSRLWMFMTAQRYHDCNHTAIR